MNFYPVWFQGFFQTKSFLTKFTLDPLRPLVSFKVSLKIIQGKETASTNWAQFRFLFVLWRMF